MSPVKKLVPIKVKTKNILLLLILVIVSIKIVILINNNLSVSQITDNNDKREYEEYLAECLEEDKGTGCGMPDRGESFYRDLTKYNNYSEPIICGEPDWVKCRFSTCNLQPEILNIMEQIQCIYQDIIHISDKNYKLDRQITLKGNKVYVLRKSDYVRVYCSAFRKGDYKFFWNIKTWAGFGFGIRRNIPQLPPPGREHSINIVIIALDSVSKNQFIRMLPKSYKFIEEDLKATVLNKYNIVSHGTKEAIIPILSGKRYFELKESRKYFSNEPFDQSHLIFGKLESDGYRTAYFEDRPNIATFSTGFNGFSYQPTDHYLFSFCRDVRKMEDRDFCVGDTPQFKVNINLTDQITQIKGKHFVFCFIVDISHDDPKFLPNADEPLMDFLKGLLKRGQQKDTLIMIMGDHGIRFGDLRLSFNAHIEERSPFFAIRLPEVLRQRLPGAQSALEMNAEVLTTPHDIHTTLLDAVDLPQHMVHYKVKGATLLRGLSLLKLVPQNRSCSEAGITPFWCNCIEWEELNKANPMYERTGLALLSAINAHISFLRARCAIRTLTSIDWVKKGCVPKHIITHSRRKTRYRYENYFAKITVGPGDSVFEGMVKYDYQTNELRNVPKGISRTNRYGNEPLCIENTHPHLVIFCYCI